MTYEIEKGIPVPRSTHVNRQVYPFHEMEVGDSFTVSFQKARTVRARAHSFGKEYKKVFTTRRQGDVLRVWRVA